MRGTNALALPKGQCLGMRAQDSWYEVAVDTGCGEERVSFVRKQGTLRAVLRVRSGPAKGLIPAATKEKRAVTRHRQVSAAYSPLLRMSGIRHLSVPAGGLLASVADGARTSCTSANH